MASDKIVPSLLSNSPLVVMPSNPDSKDCSHQVIPMSPLKLMASNLARSNSSLRSSKKRHSIIHGHAIRKVFPRKPIQPIELTVADISYRLTMAKFFSTRLGFVCDAMSFLATLGIILMIVDNELTFSCVNDDDTRAGWYIKPIITCTTIILLGLILYYHYLDLKLYAVQNCLEDCRVVLTKTKIYLIITEILICAIHPVPHNSLYADSLTFNLNTNSSSSYPLSYITLDVALGLPMFARIYLFARSIMLHSHLARNVSLRSMSYLNQVSIDFFFLIKTYLQIWPTRFLLIILTIVFLIGSWGLRACSYKATDHLSMLDAMWLFIITFTTVGFGDIYPTTYCGRGIAAVIGFVGLISAALLISVLTQKLLLTREEKYVHAFVLNTELAKERQHEAANIVKFSMKVWYLKRQNKPMSIRRLQAQHKLFRSIDNLKQIKKQQRSSVDSCVGFHELLTTQRNTSVQHDETIQQMTDVKCDIKKIEEELKTMTHSMNKLQVTLNVLLEK